MVGCLVSLVCAGTSKNLWAERWHEGVGFSLMGQVCLGSSGWSGGASLHANPSSPMGRQKKSCTFGIRGQIPELVEGLTAVFLAFWDHDLCPGACSKRGCSLATLSIARLNPRMCVAHHAKPSYQMEPTAQAHHAKPSYQMEYVAKLELPRHCNTPVSNQICISP